MGEDTRRIHITFPVQLLEELDALIPARKRSEVIVRATVDYLRKLKILSALEQSAGAWDDASHPELASPGN
jgi:metal-responsive CopG/Arc/MetJ family transcriptional regulator